MKEYNNYVSYKDIVSHIDIKEGDIVIVSSDVLKLSCVCRENNEVFDPNAFINTIIKKIGDTGTLLFPAYNWGFCKGETFDYHNTLSQTGGLANTALKRKDFRRTKHPIYSFAVWGRDQDYLCNLNNISGWGANSPFAYLYERHAKNLFVGIDYKDAFAPAHYAEEKVGVSYRFFKDFTAPYIAENGMVKKLTYRMYVRDLRLCALTKISPLIDDVLLRKGYYLRYSINGIYFGLIDLHGIGDIMEDDIRTKGGLVYPQKDNSTISKKFQEQISLRKANNNDCYDVWMWRNAPEARERSFNKEYIEYAKHREWFKKKLKDKKTAIYIAENNKKEKIGQARFVYDGRKEIAYVNMNLNPKFFGKGLGNRLIKSATQTFLKEHHEIKEVIAEIFEENIVSQKAFTKAKYVFSRSSHKNERKIVIFKFRLEESNV